MNIGKWNENSRDNGLDHDIESKGECKGLKGNDVLLFKAPVKVVK